VALVYVNRSGSTLLSRLISERFGDVHVFPELAFPLQMLSGPPNADLRDLVARDPRSEAIGLDGQTLREICARHSPASAAAFLADLATAARGGRAPATIVFKLESLLYVHQELATAFPGLGMIHIVRDPRAMSNPGFSGTGVRSIELATARGSRTMWIMPSPGNAVASSRCT